MELPRKFPYFLQDILVDPVFYEVGNFHFQEQGLSKSPHSRCLTWDQPRRSALSGDGSRLKEMSLRSQRDVSLHVESLLIPGASSVWTSHRLGSGSVLGGFSRGPCLCHNGSLSPPSRLLAKLGRVNIYQPPTTMAEQRRKERSSACEATETPRA
ncbi:hypothetical protein WMY93_015954 [Mugilogobius chulae]|uniref:Uncharacterized protein n=1 Tax=Mugilogobius chulae TaxID=88201 RepID=A0AAW0NU51_9GOBI